MTSTGRCLLGRTRHQNRANPTTGGWSPHLTYWRAFLCRRRHKHDLRHTFAVNNLRGWFAHGDDVGALLPVLQAYMGHASPDDTAYYLRLTAESYPHITAQVQRVVGDVVPQVTGAPRHGN